MDLFRFFRPKPDPYFANNIGKRRPVKPPEPAAMVSGNGVLMDSGTVFENCTAHGTAGGYASLSREITQRQLDAFLKVRNGLWDHADL